jgi:hypothetical protein
VKKHQAAVALWTGDVEEWPAWRYNRVHVCVMLFSNCKRGI